MYILVNKSMMILGIFTSKKKLNDAVAAIRSTGDTGKLYWQKFVPNTFDSILPNFWTMHFEKLNEICNE